MAAAADPAGDDRFFKVDFTSTGEKLLQERLREKLREFMSAPDDSLVLRDLGRTQEYVILLLTGGIHKDDACQKLNVFLEDDSTAFISWLWDHLSLHFHLYVKAQEQNQQQIKDVEPPKEVSGEHKPSEVLQISKVQTHSEHTIESSVTTRKRNKREWKGTGREGNEKFPLRSVLTDILHGEEKRSQKSSEIRHPPLKQQNGRKRDWDDEPLQTKRDVSSRPMLGGGASRRLLQFAVRDAVKAVQPSSSSSEPASKRLRSVVSTAFADNRHDKRLERPQDCLNDRRPERTRPMLQESEEESGELTMANREDEMSVDSTSDDDLDQDENITRYQSSGSQEDAFESLVEKKTSLVRCSTEPETNAIRHSSVINKEQPISLSTAVASKTMAVPADVSTVEPINYETPKDVHVVEKPYITPTNANTTSLPSNIKEVVHAEVQKDSQRSAPSVAVSYSTSHPTEDADSRTLYITNVHYAATKDSLSRHFNKFGAVLKVVIVTNAASGQPTGSAYVEFLHKESAERALSLNGTSFMTRILKVVRRSSHEVAHFYGWNAGGRSLNGRGRIYPRTILPSNSFRGRASMKSGARSLQWKREPSGTDSSAGHQSDKNVTANLLFCKKPKKKE
ncbi:hypothetical protein PR202_gb02738 [Eleusine coracana subsp. coracana]|uniref:RRM domain-containing protein n=1 Tax=Eleusine coracana subsp. coracana TaxID=191504 RepID=A0AAV5DZD4_ELECO|nr:hypothetical protein PR202_gb02738 [Eleusine coracana subsp. coracana]